MASRKFEKNSVEWQMFMEYWGICQRIWEPESGAAYWESVLAEVQPFYNKYKDTDAGTFAKRLAVALAQFLEEKQKDKVKESREAEYNRK